jgi:hypothetical protein
MIVTLGGYKAFTRGAGFWNSYTFSWGYTLAPYAVMAVFITLIAARLVRFRLVGGFWSLRVPLLQRIDLCTGAVSVCQTPLVGLWERHLDKILDAL